MVLTMADDHDRTGCVGRTVLADGTEKHPGETTVSTAAYDQQIGPVGLFYQDQGGMALDDPCSDLDAALGIQHGL
jgi:hypothetical protein